MTTLEEETLFSIKADWLLELGNQEIQEMICKDQGVPCEMDDTEYTRLSAVWGTTMTLHPEYLPTLKRRSE